MKKQMQNRPVQIGNQVEKVRRLYSRIGEPLPADLIIDLHRHLGAALKQVQTEKPSAHGENRRIRV